MDISNKAIEMARRNLPEGVFFKNDISREAVNLKADLVLCCDVLEHIDDYKAALFNIKKMTGRFFLLTTLQGRMRPFEKNVGHVRSFKKDELLQDLKKSGFTIVRVIEWGFPFYSPIYRSLFDSRKVQGFSCGEYGFFKRMVSNFIYFLFCLNSWRRGDYLIILCKV